MLKVSKLPWVAVEGSKMVLPPGGLELLTPLEGKKVDEFASKALPLTYDD